MFPLRWDFPFRKKDGSLSTISAEIEGGGGGGYTLPTASASTKGGIKVGENLTMTGEFLDADDQLPSYSTAEEGKVLSVDSEGELEWSSPASGGAIYMHEVLIGYGGSNKIAINLFKPTSTPLTFTDIWNLSYNDGAPITLYGMWTSATSGGFASLSFAIQAELQDETKKIKFTMPGSTTSQPESAITITDKVIQM